MADSLGGILTNGAGADFNGLILGPFRLKVGVGEPFVPPGGGPGGSGGVATGSEIPISDIYRDEEKRKRTVTFEVKMGDTIIDKTFLVSVERASKIVQVVKWANTFIAQTQFRIGKLKRKYGSIVVRFKKKDK